MVVAASALEEELLEFAAPIALSWVLVQLEVLEHAAGGSVQKCGALLHLDVQEVQEQEVHEVLELEVVVMLQAPAAAAAIAMTVLLQSPPVSAPQLPSMKLLMQS